MARLDTTPRTIVRPSSPLQSVVAVVPAFNEAARIGPVVAALRDVVDAVVVVDDGSGDATGETAAAAGALVLRHRINRGQGAALQTGIEFALERGAGIVVTFDADGQHAASDVAALVAPIRAGECEITLGSRSLGGAEGIPRQRRLVLWLGVLFTRWTNGLAVTDTHNGLRAFSAAAASRLHLTLDRMAHASELLDQVGAMGLPWREVPVHVRYTAEMLAKGQSSLAALRIAARVIWRRIRA